MENNDTIFSDINSDETEAATAQIFLSRLIDFVADVSILVLLFKFIPSEIYQSVAGKNSYFIFILVIVVSILSRFLFLIFFSKTLGMIICRIKYLNGSFQPLSTKEKLKSLFRTRFSPVRYYKDK
jgi:uncharacterized RDD family membrane protein YckC